MDIDQLLKRIALLALIFVLSGYGISHWLSIAEKGIKQYQIYSAQAAAAKTAYWEADYWKHHVIQPTPMPRDIYHLATKPN